MVVAAGCEGFAVVAGCCFGTCSCGGGGGILPTTIGGSAPGPDSDRLSGWSLPSAAPFACGAIASAFAFGTEFICVFCCSSFDAIFYTFFFNELQSALVLRYQYRL